MKITTGDAYDRFLEFKQQGDYISQGCQDCINNRPAEFGNHPFYIFAHKREIGLDERISIFNQDLQEALLNPLYYRKFKSLEEVPTARLIWQPRLLKPQAQTNSMLFKAYPPGDNIKVIWMIPDRALWGQEKKGNITETSIVSESIHKFMNNKEQLEVKEEDDLPDSRVNRIYKEIAKNNKKVKLKI